MNRHPLAWVLLRAGPLLGLLGCAPSETERTPVDSGEELVELAIPEVTDGELEAAADAALALALRTTGVRAWAGHRGTMVASSPACPDRYAGVADPDRMDVRADGGLSWNDACTASTGLEFAGWAWWDVEVAAEGDPTEPAGLSVTASRELVADAFVSTPEQVWFELDGEVEDSLTWLEAPGLRRWTYASTLVGRVEVDPSLDGGALPGGYRTDLYLRSTGQVGDDGATANTFEARGNLYFPVHRLEGRFDSVAMELSFADEGAADPESCTAEPRGWIGVRDPDATWFDLVFQPRFEGDPLAPDGRDPVLAACDGCGVLSIRGLPQQGRLVCPDWAAVWDVEGDVPVPEDFVWSLRDLVEDR